MCSAKDMPEKFLKKVQQEKRLLIQGVDWQAVSARCKSIYKLNMESCCHPSPYIFIQLFHIGAFSTRCWFRSWNQDVASCISSRPTFHISWYVQPDRMHLDLVTNNTLGESRSAWDTDYRYRLIATVQWHDMRKLWLWKLIGQSTPVAIVAYVGWW